MLSITLLSEVAPSTSGIARSVMVMPEFNSLIFINNDKLLVKKPLPTSTTPLGLILHITSKAVATSKMSMKSRFEEPDLNLKLSESQFRNSLKSLGCEPLLE